MAVPSTADVSDDVRLESSRPDSAKLEVREYGLEEACRLHSTEWHDLLKRGDFNISLAPEFIKASAASVGMADRVRVVVAQRGSALVGVMPFIPSQARMLSVPMNMLGLAGNLISYHHELVAPGCQAEMLRACLGDPKRRWHVLCMENVPVDGPTSQALDSVARELGFAHVSYAGDVAPYVPIDQTWEQFLAARSSSFRYNLKRKEKSLRNGGALEERWFHGLDDVPELYRCMEAIESNSWKNSAQVAVTSQSTEALYYQEVLPFLARHGLLFANVLYLDSKPVAYHLCYYFEGRVGNMKTSFDETKQSLSPGAVVIQRAIQHAFQRGAREFDFLGDDQYHKRLWTDQSRAHRTHFLFSRDLRSRAVGLAKTLIQARRNKEFHAVVRRGEVVGS